MRAILLVAAVLILAPAAHAQSLSVPVLRSEAVVGPSLATTASTVALAAGRVAWLEPRGDRLLLVSAGPDGVRRRVTSFPVPREERRQVLLAGSGSGTSVVLQRPVCRRTCDATSVELLQVDLVSGAKRRLRPCPQDPADESPSLLAFRGTVLAATCRDGARVTDLADGTSGLVQGRLDAVAGRFAAAVKNATAYDETVVVTDWRTGAVVARVDEENPTEPVLDLTVDDDGAMAWARGNVVRHLPAGAAAPTEVGPGDEVELVGGVLASRNRAHWRFSVGGKLAESQGSTPGGRSTARASRGAPSRARSRSSRCGPSPPSRPRAPTTAAPPPAWTGSRRRGATCSSGSAARPARRPRGARDRSKPPSANATGRHGPNRATTACRAGGRRR